MKLIYPYMIVVLLLLAQTTTAQHLHNVEHIQTVSKQTLESQLQYPVLNGVQFYKMTYHTTGSDGLPDIASGLIVLPGNNAPEHSLVVYHHGTSNAPHFVPSSLNLDYEAYALFGGYGYAVLAPDYLGMGDSRGFHPYVHRETQASASVDMIRAFREWADEGNTAVNENLFLTGYSQGGHASMSTHWKMEAELQEEFEVTAAAHLSGPYSISGVMRDLMFSEQNYDFPGFIPFVILGYQEVYGNVYNELTDIFRPDFIPAIEAFYNGDATLTGMTILLVLTMQQKFGNRHPVNLFNPALVTAMQENDNHPINILLRENDTYDWAPQAPTRIFYCTADNMVPWQNSFIADSVMQVNGAVDLQTIDVNPAFDHGQCAVPAMLATLDFFNSFQETSVADVSPTPDIQIFPNPGSGIVQISGLDEYQGYQVQVLDLSGRLLTESHSSPFVNLEKLPAGVYLLRISGKDFQLTRKIVRQ